MALLDTNIFIYLASGALAAKSVDNIHLTFASITKIEALGYGKISAAEKYYLEELFSSCEQIDLDDNVIERAIILRLQQPLSLGDAIIAATAIEADEELWTANTADFTGIDELKLINPLKPNSAA